MVGYQKLWKIALGPPSRAHILGKYSMHAPVVLQMNLFVIRPFILHILQQIVYYLTWTNVERIHMEHTSKFYSIIAEYKILLAD